MEAAFQNAMAMGSFGDEIIIEFGYAQVEAQVPCNPVRTAHDEIVTQGYGTILSHSSPIVNVRMMYEFALYS